MIRAFTALALLALAGCTSAQAQDGVGISGKAVEDTTTWEVNQHCRLVITSDNWGYSDKRGYPARGRNEADVVAIGVGKGSLPKMEKAVRQLRKCARR
jgi:hypothetical protein